MDHLKIGIDFDDVLFKTAEKTADLYNARYGTQLTKDNWYNFSPMSPWGTDKLPEAVRRVVEIMASDEFVGVTPIEGARIVLEELRGQGDELIVLTGRPEAMRRITLLALKECYPDIFSQNGLYFTNHFGKPDERVGKGSIAKQLGLTHFIDDQVEHVQDVASEGVQAILFSDNYAWNQTQLDEDIVRVSNWEEIGAYFEDVHRGRAE